MNDKELLFARQYLQGAIERALETYLRERAALGAPLAEGTPFDVWVKLVTDSETGEVYADVSVAVGLR